MNPGFKLTSTNKILSDSQVTGENRVRKMQILRTGKFSDPRYGRFEVTKAMLKEMVDNFEKNTRGVTPALDYKHDAHDIAAGWFRKLWLAEDKDGAELWAEIEMTPKGDSVVEDKEFRYVSADFDTNYKDNESLKNFGCVLLGAGLTNRPVVKRMQAVQLSEKEADPVSEKIKKLIGEGKTQDQAVAIALEMERSGKLSETEGDQMNEEEKKKMADQEAMLGAYKKCADAMGVGSAEELLAKITELLKGKEGVEKEKGEIEVELATTKKELAEARSKVTLSEKSAKFNLLLSEGKAVEAQRESYISGDMDAFLAKSVAVKLSEQGHAGTNAGQEITTKEQAEEEISKKAKKLSEEKGLDIGSAIVEVMKQNKKLAELREGK